MLSQRWMPEKRTARAKQKGSNKNRNATRRDGKSHAVSGEEITTPAFADHLFSIRKCDGQTGGHPVSVWRITCHGFCSGWNQRDRHRWLSVPTPLRKQNISLAQLRGQCLDGMLLPRRGVTDIRHECRLDRRRRVLRQMSATGMPSAPCFRMNAFWTSKDRDAFIALRSSQPGHRQRKASTKNDPILWPQVTQQWRQ
jgi:hypothetical protein